MSVKYKKGEFIVLPNKEVLRSLPPAVQTLFFWICSYSDETGFCFPTRSRLAKDCGISIKTLDRSMKMLVEVGILEKEERIRGKVNTSNGYQIMVVDTGGVASYRRHGGVKNDPRGGVKNDIQNYIHKELNIDNLPEADASGADVNKIIDLFKLVNPMFTSLYKRTPQRNAVKALVRNLGFDKLSDIIKYLPTSNRDKYAPKITTPCQLEENLGRLIAWSESKKSGGGEGKVAFS